MEFIKRTDAVKQIYSGQCFDLEFVTADVKRGTGGDLIELRGWQITGAESEKAPAGSRQATTGTTKPANHDQHETINVCNPGNKGMHPITIHIKLIQSFNGKRILNG